MENEDFTIRQQLTSLQNKIVEQLAENIESYDNNEDRLRLLNNLEPSRESLNVILDIALLKGYFETFEVVKIYMAVNNMESN